MRQFAKNALNAVRQIQQNVQESSQPPLEGAKPDTNRVVDTALVAYEAVFGGNTTYENGWYDACAVMLRRFIETLIIEAYIAKKLEARSRPMEILYFRAAN